MNNTIINDIDAIDETAWEDLLKESKYSNYFHSKSIYCFWQSLAGFNPFIYAFVDKNKKIKVLITGVVQKEKGLVKGYLSRRGIIFGGPLLSDDKNIDFLLQKTLEYMVDDLRKKVIYLETRNLNDYSNLKDVFFYTGWDYNPHLNFKVNCQNDTEIKKKMSKSKIRQVNQSLKEGAEIINADCENQILEFYNILLKLYNSKVNKPLMSESFFLNFFRQNLGIFLLIKYKDRIIGGIMCPILDKRTIYEWYIAGEDNVHKKVYPSVLATWAAIDYAHKNKIEFFDFMGAGKPNEDYGVREFKSKFGGELVEHGRFIRILEPLLFELGKLGLKIYKNVK